MRITVFGGAGFLGSHACDKLSEAGHELTVFDIRKSEWLCAGQKSITGDILDENAVAAAVQGADVVYNFAGIADIGEANLRPVDTVKYNVLGNVNVLEACKNAGVKRFIFASSLYVYSKGGGFYRCSKQASELYVENYRAEYGLEYTILRYGSLYGPRADMRNGIYRFVRQAMESGKISYYGTARALREYIHVHDAADCTVEILGEKYANTNIVLTGSQPMRITDLFTMISEMLGGGVEFEYLEDTENKHYEITPYSFNPKLGHKMSPRLSIDLGQGILATIEEIYRDMNPDEVKLEGYIMK